MSPVIATVLTGAAVLLGVWRLVDGIRIDLTAQITAVNMRIDNVLLADRSARVDPGHRLYPSLAAASCSRRASSSCSFRISAWLIFA